MATNIHPTAIIMPGATLGDNVEVGPYAYVGADVTIGDGTTIAHHATVDGCTVMGRDNQVYPYAFVGGLTQDKKYTGGKPGLRIGDRNIFREFCSMHGATKEGDWTVIGNGNLFLAYSHVAHECIVGDNNIVSSHSALGGHAIIENHVNVGWNAGVHQFARIGSHVMIGACSKVAQDVPPFMLCDGSPAECVTINKVGMRRCGYTEEEVNLARSAYKTIFRANLNRAQALERLQAHPEAATSRVLQALIKSMGESTRGIA